MPLDVQKDDQPGKCMWRDGCCVFCIGAQRSGVAVQGLCTKQDTSVTDGGKEISSEDIRARQNLNKVEQSL